MTSSRAQGSKSTPSNDSMLRLMWKFLLWPALTAIVVGLAAYNSGCTMSVVFIMFWLTFHVMSSQEFTFHMADKLRSMEQRLEELKEDNEQSFKMIIKLVHSVVQRTKDD